MSPINPMAGASWLKRLSGYVRAKRRDPPDDVCGDLPATRPGGELGGASAAQWLLAIARTGSSSAAARRRVGEQMAGIQASIIFMQDHLSDDDEIGRQALKIKIDCAERYHQAARRFNRLLDEVVRVTALTPKLTAIMALPSAPESASAPASAPAALDRSRRRSGVSQQLARIERQLEQLSLRPAAVSACQTALCMASLGAVATLLARQIAELGGELRQLVAVIDELDQLILKNSLESSFNAAATEGSARRGSGSGR